ncbi:putative nadph oxidase [Diplodia seriata]|uniref:Putative nadph oxidase n=1 Tax=Diplodia seriata TaxID=420778 RepID=A0A0G2G837_9PEZI|nr:putative nadph oxidase [Diplodia seriata]
MAAKQSWTSHFIPRKLLFYFIFHGLHIGIFAFGWYKQAAEPRLAALNGLKFSVWISRGAGLVLSFDVLFILLPMCRTLLRVIRPKVRWLPLDESQWFHRQVAYAMVFWTATHVLAHYVNFFNVEKTQGWRWELWGGGIYLFERLYREVRARRDTRIVKVVRHPYDAVEIQFTKPSMRYKPGQWLFINCPSVSGYQWHPFTITSCPYDPYISIHVRQVGDFTRAFADALGAGPAQSKLYDDMDPNGMYEIALQHGQEMPAIRIDGPYGAPAEDVFDNEIAVLIGTGIGVTPWASILKNIWHMRLSPNPPKRLRRVEFIWVCKDTSSFEWFQALLSSLEAQSPGSGPNGNEDFLRIHTYLTQKVDVDTANNIVLNSVGTDKDPLTELKSRTNFGRPDFSKLLVGMRDGIMTRSYMSGLESSLRTDVGVYFCGPSVAARDINKACKAATCPDVRFRFWKEHF